MCGETPLIIAVYNELTEIIELLINDKRFDPIESKLNTAFALSNYKIANQLYSLNCLDVNQLVKSSSHDNLISSLNISILNNDVDKIDLIIKHQSFNIYKSKIKNCIFTACDMNNIIAFQKLMPIINGDVNIVNDKHQSLIEFSSKHLSGNIIDEILNNEHFDSKSDQILKAFVRSYSNPNLISTNNGEMAIILHQDNEIEIESFNFFKIKTLNKDSIPKKSSIIEIMEKILNYDDKHENLINFNELLPNGKSFFTTICNDFPDIQKVIDFLLSHGVDPKKPDKKGVYPLEHAIKINSLEFVKSLVNTEKIEYSQIKNGNSYLHLAAQKKDSSILSFLLQKNLIDVKSVNEIGETPLFEACKSLCVDNINLLFKNDNLDYLHYNKNGKNALDIVVQLPQNELESIKQNKEKYRNKLIAEVSKKLDSDIE